MISLVQSDNICGAVEDTLKRAACGDLKPTFIIVPDRLTLQAERILLRHKSCLLNVRVVTFSMMFRILREELGAEAEVLEKTPAVLFMWRAIQSVKDRLIWFGRSVGMYAFAEKMFNTINQLSSSMVDFDVLVSNSRGDITRKKMHDIALIREAYKKLIASYTDSSGELGWLIENIRHSKVVKGARVFVAGFGHLSIQRGAVVGELVKHAGEFVAGFQKGSELEELLAHHVLNTKCTHVGVPTTKVSSGELRNFDTLQDEAGWVANEVCRLVKNDGVRFRDIVVVAADYESSAKVFAQVFAENGIEVNLDVGADLLGHPVAQFVREYLLLAATGGQVHFLNIVKSVYSGLGAEQEFETENKALKNGTRGNETTAPIIKKILKCRTAKEFCTVLAEITPNTDDVARKKLLELLETVGRVSGEQQISLSEFINMFTALATATKVSDIPELSDAVLLVSVAEYQPSFMPYVFVTGASDGVFPVAQDDTDIITAQDIANTNVRIEPSATMQNLRNRRHASDIFRSATTRLYISYTGQTPSELIEKMKAVEDSSEVASKTFAAHSVLKAIGDGTAFEDTDYYGNVLESLDLGGMKYTNPNMPLAQLKDAEKLFFPTGTARVTQIENFRKCPFYHFLEHGLRVKVRERNIIAANIMGTVIHKLAEDFTQKIIEVGRQGLENLDAVAEMKKVVEKVLNIEEFRFLTLEPKNAPVISNLRKEARLLAGEIVRQIKESLYFPKHVELPLQGDIDGIVVRGKVDRIDVGGKDNAVIIDYKTGVVDKQNLQSLQLPLYIEFLSGKYTVDGAFYHYLRPDKYSVYEASVPGAKDAASEIVRKMKQGVISPNPVDEKACRYCVAKAVCSGGEPDEN